MALCSCQRRLGGQCDPGTGLRIVSKSSELGCLAPGQKCDKPQGDGEDKFLVGWGQEKAGWGAPLLPAQGPFPTPLPSSLKFSIARGLGLPALCHLTHTAQPRQGEGLRGRVEEMKERLEALCARGLRLMLETCKDHMAGKERVIQPAAMLHLHATCLAVIAGDCRAWNTLFGGAWSPPCGWISRS